MPTCCVAYGQQKVSNSTTYEQQQERKRNKQTDFNHPYFHEKKTVK